MQGIVHVIGPELGLTQPGMTIACGDSHTSTHGAFGAIAFGIGTSQVRDVLATQCLALDPLKVRRIDVTGRLAPGVYAKDVILEIIRRLGVKGGVGFAYEYAGDAIERMSMDERMTICNMSIEGGARVGYVNPDETTFDYLRGRPFAPQGDAFDEACAWWQSHGVRPRRASTTTRSTIDAGEHRADGDLGHQSRASRSASTSRCRPGDAAPDERGRSTKRSTSWGFTAGGRSRARRSTSRSSAPAPTRGCPTCARRRAVVRGRHVAPHVQALVVPGRSRCGRRPSAKGSIESSSTPASSGAAPAARCAWR